MAVKRIFILVFLGVLGAFFFRQFAFEGIYIASESMEPTLPKGTRVMVNKISTKFRNPRRGEVVMFRIPDQKKRGFVKRVIAVPGDRVAIKNKTVYLNGQVLAEPYVQHTRADERLADDTLSDMTVPNGHVFVLGDNRDVSNDSRDWHNSRGESTPFLPVGNIDGLLMRP